MNLLINFTGFIFVLLFLFGIRRMSSPETAVSGNAISAFGMLGAIVLTLAGNGILDYRILWLSMALGGVIGYFIAIKVTMLKMPQTVALLNGLGGGASAGTALLVIGNGGAGIAAIFTAALALIVGGVTLSGSLIAAAKLDQKMQQRPVLLKWHSAINAALILVSVILLIIIPFAPKSSVNVLAGFVLLFSLLFGIVFTIRIGGADMPISISLLNSLSGVAGSIAGFAVKDPMLVATGAIVGAAGLILTRIMCNAMNRYLMEVLLGKTTSAVSQKQPVSVVEEPFRSETANINENGKQDNLENAFTALRNAKSVVIVPGYGMALSQAQFNVKKLFDILEKNGKDVSFAIHPVAGRMPGHMNVLLAEADLPYEKMLEIDTANKLFTETDVAIVIGANDVINPSATTAVGTPIYGMPILNVSEARKIMIFNKDTKPGYSGVDNPLYGNNEVSMFIGDANEKIGELLKKLYG